MKMLVSTGEVPYGEFCFVPEGEIVVSYGVVCSDKQTRAACGCAKSVSGISTHRATSTAKVAEVEMSGQELFELAAKAGKEAGWGGPHIWAAMEADRKAIAELEVGTVVQPSYQRGRMVYEPIEVGV